METGIAMVALKILEKDGKISLIPGDTNAETGVKFHQR